MTKKQDPATDPDALPPEEAKLLDDDAPTQPSPYTTEDES